MTIILELSHRLTFVRRAFSENESLSITGYKEGNAANLMALLEGPGFDHTDQDATHYYWIS
jgi:hypothetical protein